MTETILQARALTREFQSNGAQVRALDGMDLDVARGEFVAIMGPSGCGKSTLLHLVGGLDRPTAGEIYLDDERVDQLSEAEWARLRRRQIGYVFQFFNLVGNLSARDNIELPALVAFYYNNWSFNAAGAIFEELTGKSLGEAFSEWIAQPTGMQEFDEASVQYEVSDESRFPAYRFWMSTRDLARFGLLMEREGRWEGQQIVSATWIDESTDPQTPIRDDIGYAEMWWTDGAAFFASGTGGQRVYIDPTSDLVIVVKVNTGQGASRARWWDSGPRITYGQFTELVAQLSSAAPQ